MTNSIVKNVIQMGQILHYQNQSEPCMCWLIYKIKLDKNSPHVTYSKLRPNLNLRSISGSNQKLDIDKDYYTSKHSAKHIPEQSLWRKIQIKAKSLY